MLDYVKQGVQSLFHGLGYQLSPYPPPDFDAATVELIHRTRHFTMTSAERIAALKEGVEYVLRHDIAGDFVECGVWRGGSMMAVALTLLRHGVTDRRLHLFDTFEGMPEPGDVDRDCKGRAARILLKAHGPYATAVRACSTLEEVRKALLTTGYDPRHLVFVKGKVEDTLPAHAPQRIALLRLDTDWYESTYHELVHLYPRLSVGGVLILDDYGHWEGARRAVDQYVAENRLRLLLNRIDYSARMCVKLDP
jgi:hypothetical protein